jgi:hypothetical protein
VYPTLCQLILVSAHPCMTRCGDALVVNTRPAMSAARRAQSDATYGISAERVGKRIKESKD